VAKAGSSSSPIKNVVVLMMENHSFDHMFGYVPGVGTLTSNPQTLPDPTQSSNPPISTWEWSAYDITPCPNHDHASTMKQLYGVTNVNQQPVGGVWPTPTMNGFLEEYYDDLEGNPTQLMGGFTPAQLPALSMLAQTYTVCTNWFCSVPGPTGPNRLFVNCASSGGYAGPAYQYNTLPSQLSTLPSVFDRLSAAKLTWQIYHEDPSFFPEGVLSSVSSLPSAMQPDPNFVRFLTDVKNNTLPSYSFLTPTLPNSQHDSWDARVGDNLISQIYNALIDSNYWEQTLFIITYDEHGGHFDHIPPVQQYLNVAGNQMVSVENPDGKLWNSATWGSDFTEPEFDFTLLGPRVPAVIISAYTPAGLDDTVYEHASISATLNALWGCGSLGKRDAVANSVLRNVTSTKRAASTLPRTPYSTITGS